MQRLHQWSHSKDECNITQCSHYKSSSKCYNCIIKKYFPLVLKFKFDFTETVYQQDCYSICLTQNLVKLDEGSVGSIIHNENCGQALAFNKLNAFLVVIFCNFSSFLFLFWMLIYQFLIVGNADFVHIACMVYLCSAVVLVHYFTLIKCKYQSSNCTCMYTSQYHAAFSVFNWYKLQAAIICLLPGHST